MKNMNFFLYYLEFFSKSIIYVFFYINFFSQQLIFQLHTRHEPWTSLNFKSNFGFEKFNNFTKIQQEYTFSKNSAIKEGVKIDERQFWHVCTNGG